MAAAEYDFELDQGSAWSIVVGYTSDGTTPVNLTGWTATMQIREFKGATDVLATGTCTIDGPAGTVTVSLTRQQTAALPPRTPLVYDLLITNGSQGVRLIEGQITLDRAVTIVA